MTRTRARAAMIAASLGFAPAAFAASHREAPLITETPKLDGTDLYLFRSYEPGRSSFVTAIANYQGLQDPFGGPNYFTMDPNAVYDINIDNQGTGSPSIAFRFRFSLVDNALALTIGGKSVPVALTELGQISTPVPATQNVVETFTLSLVTYRNNGSATETSITNADTGETVFRKPVDNIGNKTIPDYAEYASQFIYNISIPGCAKPGRAFAGQRKESFVVNLGETFDLVNYANPVGEQFSNTTANSIGDKNITSLALELPIACVVRGGDPVIGAWTTSASIEKRDWDDKALRQASRLGNPLVNELVIGLPDKDKFNASLPANDAQFANYVTNPTFPTIVQTLFDTPAPTAFPRQDLVAVFLTGLRGLNQPTKVIHPSEELRLNTTTPTVAPAKQNRLGVIAGDNAGYPNGRRPGDDVVDITLRVAMGRLYTLGLFGSSADAPSGGLDFTDGACITAKQFDTAFPYLTTPIPGSPQSAFEAASTNAVPAKPGACQ
jgi:hypothetical protein